MAINLVRQEISLYVSGKLTTSKGELLHLVILLCGECHMQHDMFECGMLGPCFSSEWGICMSSISPQRILILVPPSINILVCRMFAYDLDHYQQALLGLTG